MTKIKKLSLKEKQKRIREITEILISIRSNPKIQREITETLLTN